eukprot:3490600-Alexandrium_andersonii.AAC.1
MIRSGPAVRSATSWARAGPAASMTSLAARGSNVRSLAAAPGTCAAAQQQVTDAIEAGWARWRATTPLSAVIQGPASAWLHGT